MTSPNHRASAMEAASDWLVALQSDTASEADWLAFETWLSASEDHVAAYAAAEDLWLELDEKAVQIAARPSFEVVSLDERRRSKAPAAGRRAWFAGAIAAGLAVAVGLGAYQSDQFVPSQVYTTARGETRDVVLADGSHIFLNGASRLEVKLGHRQRQVTMADAQAVFDVAKDPKRPFVIAVGDRQVKVVGTMFDIVRHEGAMRLTVARGVVEVRPLASPDGAAVQLVRGQQFEHREGQAGEAVRSVDPDMALAWRAGRLIYHDEPLDKVAADLSRAFSSPVTAPGAASNLRFSGILQLDTEEAVIRRLEAFLPVVGQHRNGAIVLVPTAARSAS